jgi:serine/threonine-protein kinase PknK
MQRTADRRLAFTLAILAVAGIVLASCSSPSPSASAPNEPSVAPGGTPPAVSPTAAVAARESAPATLSWVELEDAPLARLEMATAAHGGQIWLAGGLSPLGEAVNEVEAFDPATDEWSSGPPLPTGIHHAALVSDGDRLILVGGYIGSSFSQPSDLVLTLDEGADAWQPGPPLPEPRGAGAAAWDGERVVFAGGVGPGGVSADVFVLAEGSWMRIGAMPRTREHLAAASDGDGRTWLLGGRIGGLDANLADVDLVLDSAITALTPLPTPRGGVAAFYLPALGACLTGGEAPEGALTTVECSAPDGSVAALTPMHVPRHGHGAGVVDGTAYVLLGGPTPGLSTHASAERLEAER